MHELFPLFRAEAAPLASQGAPRHLGEIKPQRDHLPDLVPPLFGLGRGLELRIIQNGHNLVHAGPHLFRRRAGARWGRDRENKEQKKVDSGRSLMHLFHFFSPFDVRSPPTYFPITSAISGGDSVSRILSPAASSLSEAPGVIVKNLSPINPRALTDAIASS